MKPLDPLDPTLTDTIMEAAATVADYRTTLFSAMREQAFKDPTPGLDMVVRTMLTAMAVAQPPVQHGSLSEDVVHYLLEALAQEGTTPMQQRVALLRKHFQPNLPTVKSVEHGIRVFQSTGLTASQAALALVSVFEVHACDALAKSKYPPLHIFFQGNLRTLLRYFSRVALSVRHGQHEDCRRDFYCAMPEDIIDGLNITLGWIPMLQRLDRLRSEPKKDVIAAQLIQRLVDLLERLAQEEEARTLDSWDTKFKKIVAKG